MVVFLMHIKQCKQNQYLVPTYLELKLFNCNNSLACIFGYQGIELKQLVDEWISFIMD